MAKSVSAKTSKLTKSEHEALLSAILGDVIYSYSKDEKKAKATDDLKGRMILAKLFKEQIDLAESKAKMISVLCPRRSGKSFAFLCIAVSRCIAQKGYKAAIVCLSRTHAERIYWDTMLQLNDEFNLQVGLNATKLIVKFQNGSSLVFAGAESNKEIAKIRGSKFNLVIVDESADYEIKLFNKLLFKVIQPALQDYDGQLMIGGTPGDVLHGTFYEATMAIPIIRKTETGLNMATNWRFGTEQPVEDYAWELHRWSARENVALPMLWNSFLALKQKMGWKDDNAIWRQEYLGEWVTSESVNVYSVRRHEHIWHGPVPWLDKRRNKCRFILGADFGFRDATAISIVCYTDDEPFLYEFTTDYVAKATVEMIRDMINRAESLLPTPVLLRVGDPGSGLTIMETLGVTHGLPFTVADKQQKVHHIRAYNSMLDSNLIRYRPGSPLVDEMEANRWIEKTIGTGKDEEDPKYPNDMCDAHLYAARAAGVRYITNAEAPPPWVDPDLADKLAFIAKMRDSQEPWWRTKR